MGTLFNFVYLANISKIKSNFHSKCYTLLRHLLQSYISQLFLFVPFSATLFKYLDIYNSPDQLNAQWQSFQHRHVINPELMETKGLNLQYKKHWWQLLVCYPRRRSLNINLIE
jgi:hypothetical protein